MIRINENFKALSENYLFSEIARKIDAYKAINPNADVISLGIGDVTEPLCESVIKAIHSAADEMADRATFKGYAPECGYDFLKIAILENDYLARGISLSSDEIFINDGAKSSLGHFGDILSVDNIVAVSDPVYPVYIDTNVMEGRAGQNLPDGRRSNIVYLECPREKEFTAQLPNRRADVIYLCSPNNPTGSVLNREQLSAWVEYAKKHKSIILFDSAYEAYISDPAIPHSIYEIEGAKEVAAEFRSFSKTAGFTGMRCGYTIVPEALAAYGSNDAAVSLNALWRRHQSTKFNGTAYIVQRAAEAVYSKQGKQQIAGTIAYYMNNAKTILEGLKYAGFKAYGGVNAPYIWLEIPRNMNSWTFFDKLLNECQVVGTPGVGFGPSGEGYFRLTAFAKAENVEKAMERIKQWKM
ncbi:MAG: LL-diaminopimelate aminotransferase [Candidatus Azobacteroides sp.]|nr:LL-diaminopimelate aminotransferase [Candidatus Azobacteroides sp.]